jgi:hypothetical protein
MAGLKALADQAPIYISYPQPTAAGAFASGIVFVSDGYYEIVEARCNHDVNGGASSAADVTKVTNGGAMSGATMLLTTFTFVSGARTSQRRFGATLTATKANRQLSPGDSIAVITSGTLTALVGACVTIVLRRVRPNRAR